MVSYKRILSIVLAGIGLTSVAALVYLAGPLISIGGWRPLENYIVREIAILLLAAAFASVLTLRFVKRKKAAAQIAAGIATAEQIEDDTGVLKEKMKDALATLKAASGGKADFLYDLPWYVLIGPPGSGKTTALVNSGLKFPLSGGATPAAIAGVGGTRYCDWWFTEDAVMIDTAGRYTTQDSDAKADKQSWLAFLDLLKKNRPRQPINGVLVAISLEDLMTLEPGEIAAHANAIRARLLELHDRLKVDFPVYALFTKCDLVAGFVEYFAGLSDHGRCKVWGATFQTDDKTLNLVGGVPKEFDDLVERLNGDLTDRLQEEPAPANRVLLYGFPTQIAALKQPIFNFLNQIFEPTRYHANATLRGFYFTSGTQHGAPIDRLIGALEKSFGAEQIGARAYSGLGKSYFLTELILKVIIGEAAWVSTDRGAVRRARIIQACVYSLIALVALTAAGLWWVSYDRNRDLIAQTQAEVAAYPLQAGGYAHETTISDRDLHNVLPLLHRLRNLPTGYANREMAPPLLATFGLSQRERLQTSAKQVYHVALERLFRPRLVYRLEEVLEAATNSDAANIGSIYEALKVYLMIGDTVPTDRDLIVSWMRKDWNENLYPGAANESGRKALEEHLVAMFDLDDGNEPLIALNGTLVAECRKYIARLNIAERAYQLLKSQAHQSIAPDWIAAAHGGPEFGAVYESATGEALDAIKVPGFYTYAGFQRAFIEKLPTIASQLERDNWVLGEIGTQGVIKDQLTNLGPNLLELYTRDFFPTWMQALGKLRLRPITADKPKYNVLNAAAAPTSPIKYLFESIRDESGLTRERTAGKDGADANKDRKEAKPILFSPQGGPPGAAIEAQFGAFGQALSAQSARRSAVDSVLDNLTEIDKTLQSLTLNSAQKQQTTATLRDQVATLRSNAMQFPAPFSDEMLRWVRQLESVIVGGVQEEIRAAFQNSVVPACREFVSGKYPLVQGERREATPAEFGKIFGKNQYLEAFFEKYLRPYVDTSGPIWVWRQDNPVSADFSPDTLRQFQLGQRIRDAFFGTGGATPYFTMTVIPPVLSGRGMTAKMEINGYPVVSPVQQNATPASGAVNVAWPANGARSAITVTPDGGGAPTVIEGLPSGPWSFYRLLDRGSPAQRGGGVVTRYTAFARDFEYQFTPQTVSNPLFLPPLRDFKCPTVL